MDINMNLNSGLIIPILEILLPSQKNIIREYGNFYKRTKIQIFWNDWSVFFSLSVVTTEIRYIWSLTMFFFYNLMCEVLLIFGLACVKVFVFVFGDVEFIICNKWNVP